ncbi:ArsR/SmtB family transcription factor [Wukongibacter sp. M2B1]|uniref:ArsR/SmtB family transcription factor n=1 Tax=Wukongibacter sp. M2B1 TaxID=3088895 RepID=UPI003D7A7A7F
MDKKNDEMNINYEECEKEIEELFDFEFFKALFEPIRSELLKYLALYGPKSIGEIAENFTQDRSVISRHLDIMHKQGILNKKKESRYTIYEVCGWNIVEKFEDTTKKLRKIMNSCKS